MEKKHLISDISSGERLLTHKCGHLPLRENVHVWEEETNEFEAEEREEGDSDKEENKIYDVWVQGERLVVSEEIRDALLKEAELLPSGCVWSVNDDFNPELREALIRGFCDKHVEEKLLGEKMDLGATVDKRVSIGEEGDWGSMGSESGQEILMKKVSASGPQLPASVAHGFDTDKRVRGSQNKRGQWSSTGED